MARGMMGNYHVPCWAGEKLEITSNAYLLLPLPQQGERQIIGDVPLFLNKLLEFYDKINSE